MQGEKSDYEYYSLPDGTSNYDMLYDELFFADLYIESVNCDFYLFDMNKEKIYWLGSYLMQNPLKELIDSCTNKASYYFPVADKEAAEIWKQWEKENEEF